MTSSPDSSLSHLKSHFVTSSWGGVRKLPKVFTEQGVSMLSAELHNFGSSVNCLGRRLTTYTTRDAKEIKKILAQLP